ncbi:type IV secretion system DNA-binding domain-containing protein [Candidatus Peribacteria bacterium]|nr:type IV secretion system DNA-binding domain-containing protein [Candidatus Peribacteria bacterium]MBT4240537.1 type IV secretion system DNA-binding domain-containing protein [Candidatus Peribacteria bacterium]MBT4474411.1 type IV secretion system DNA-binding domain-containing protein [Candidatus Peribacteria bacterium]
MLTFLRFLFWPIVWAIVTLGTSLVNMDMWGNIWEWFIEDPLDRTIIIITIYLFWRQIMKPGARFFYAYRQSKKLITMKVLLPRSDSKVDEEKRTEKDWKEKIAIMEQLYRALWEVKALNIWTVLHMWLWRFNTMSFELFVEKNEITFYVVTRPQLFGIVEKQITSFYPNAEITLDDNGTPEVWPKGTNLVGYYMKLHKKFLFPLRFYENMQDDPLNDITNVLSKLRENEHATIQIIINPSFSDSWQKTVKKFATQSFKGKKPSTFSIPGLGFVFDFIRAIFVPGADTSTLAPGASGGDSFVRMIQPEEELYKRMGEKAGMSGFNCSVRIMAASPSTDRAIEITNNMQVAYNVFKDLYGNWFDNRRMFVDFLPYKWNAPIIHWLWKHRLNGFLHKRCLLTERELATIYHFPDSRYNKIPTIKWIQYKVLPPPPNLPKEGIILGRNRYRAKMSDVRMLDDDRTRHQYIIGKSGSGKSALISYMARQDIARGEGVCVVDPHGDLIENILHYVPKERAKDVIVFNPADSERPMGLNLLEAKTDEEKDRASLDAMEIFIKLFGNEIFGPRIQHYFRNGCLTLMDDEEEGATIIDVPRMFVDEEFQKYKVSKCKNPVVRTFWEHEMAKTGAREKEEMIPYFSSKFGPFITNTTMRNIIGQPHSAFDIREIMDNKKILLVNLSKGKIGDTNAQLLGLIFVNKVNMAALSRADMPESERQPFYLYVDEFQNFTTDAFATILSEARKYKLALIMAHQYIGQLVAKTSAYEQQSTKLRDAVFGNVGTMLSFKIGAEDAEYMAKEYAPVLSEQDVIGIANYKCYIKLNIKNTTSRPFSMETIWDETDKNAKIAELVKEYSRMKYGRKKVFVDQEIGDRIGL